MRVWLIKDGENLPLQKGSRRMRTGILSAALAERGCQVDWWTSTFSHQRKTKVADHGDRHAFGRGCQLNFLECGKYRRNISVARFRHHHRFGIQLERKLETSDRPDLIICSFPIIEAAYRVSRWATRHDVPLIIDARDYWPDLYTHRLPAKVKWLSRLAFASEFRKTAEAFSAADSIVGIGEGILNWACNYAGRTPGSQDRVFYTGYPDPRTQASTTLPAGPPAFLADHLADKSRCVFSFIGMFNGSYKVDVICRAAEILSRAGEDRAIFVLAGEGERRPQVASMASNLPNVLLPGWLDGAAITQLLQHSDVGLIPCLSHADTLPNKMYEYFALGLPVISSLRGEAEEWLQQRHVGLTYDALDAEQLANCIRTYLDKPTVRQSSGQRARQLYESQFNEQKIYSAYADHAISLATRSRERRLAA